MKFFIVVIILLASHTFFGQSIKNDTGFVLQGKINCTQNRLIYLQYSNQNKVWFTDSTFIKNGEFTFRGNVNVYTQLAYIHFDDSTEITKARIPLENRNMNIEIDCKDFKHFSLTGSPSWDEYQQFYKKTQKYYLQIDSIKNLQGYSTESNRFFVQRNNKIIKDNYNHIKDELINYVSHAPNSNISPILIWENDWVFDRKITEVYFLNLSSTQQQSAYGTLIEKKIAKDKIKEQRIKKRLPAFAFTNIKNLTIQSTQYASSRFLLLEFWGSWCQPCRAEHPELIALFHKYKKSGFNIISVALDVDRNKWNTAIQNDKIFMWQHSLYNKIKIKKSNQTLNDYLQIEHYPTLVLLDRNFNILDDDISIKDLEKMLSGK